MQICGVWGIHLVWVDPHIDQQLLCTKFTPPKTGPFHPLKQSWHMAGCGAAASSSLGLRPSRPT